MLHDIATLIVDRDGIKANLGKLSKCLIGIGVIVAEPIAMYPVLHDDMLFAESVLQGWIHYPKHYPIENPRQLPVQAHLLSQEWGVYVIE